MKGTNLILNDRKCIQHSLEQGFNKAMTVIELKRSSPTISKEVKRHRKFKFASAYGRSTRYFCENVGTQKQCFSCKKKCENLKERQCKRREKIGICSRCPDNPKCELDKYYYRANKAHQTYLNTLSDSREGVNMTSSRMIMVADILRPVLKKDSRYTKYLRIIRRLIFL